MVLAPFESSFLQELKGLDVPRDDRLMKMLTEPVSAEVEDILQPVIRRIHHGSDKNLEKSAKGAYQAFLGYYLGQMKRMRMNRKDDLAEVANRFSSLMGLSEVPKLNSQMVGKMGLKGVNGIVIDTSSPVRGGGGGGGGRMGHADGRRAPSSAGKKRTGTRRG
jgi:ATP-dependent RNA helicase MSS116